MKFEGTFDTTRAYLLNYKLVYGTANCKYKNDKLKLNLTYEGTYNYNQTIEITMKKLDSNLYRGHILLGIQEGETIFAGHNGDQIFAIHFHSKYNDLSEIEIGKSIKGQYISINPGDRGDIKFRRIS